MVEWKFPSSQCKLWNSLRSTGTNIYFPVINETSRTALSTFYSSKANLSVSLYLGRQKSIKIIVATSRVIQVTGVFHNSIFIRFTFTANPII